MVTKQTGVQQEAINQIRARWAPALVPVFWPSCLFSLRP